MNREEQLTKSMLDMANGAIKERVDIDTMAYDVDGWYLDSGRDFEGLAWMPLPEPWEGAK